MEWLLLSSATEIKVLNCSNHRQAQPARNHNQDGAGERVPGCGGTCGCSCAVLLLCDAGISLWSRVVLQLFRRSYGLCFEALCWQAVGARVPAAQKPLGNGGEPSPLFRWGSAVGCCTASITAAPLLPLLSLLLFSGPPIPQCQNCTPPKSHTLGTLFCHHQLGTGTCQGAETGTMVMENAALQGPLIHMWVAAGKERAIRPCASGDGPLPAQTQRFSYHRRAIRC